MRWPPPPPRFSHRLLALGESPQDHVVFYYGALLQFVLDGVCMVWTSLFEQFLEVIVRLPCLALEIVLDGRDMLLIGAIPLHCHRRHSW
jgi:hypothetical protein